MPDEDIRESASLLSATITPVAAAASSVPATAEATGVANARGVGEPGARKMREASGRGAEPARREQAVAVQGASLAPTRRGLLAASIVAAACGLGLFLWISIGSHRASPYPIAWFIIVAAILGSIMNEPFRPDEERRASYRSTAAYMVWKGSIAIVFAFVVYLMSIGELVGGELFPKFISVSTRANPGWGMEEFLVDVVPGSYQDVAKVLIWSFIAGYAERFVPNLIGQLVRRTEDGDKGKPASSAT